MEFTKGEGKTMGEGLPNYCCKPQVGAANYYKPTVVEAVKEAAAWTRRWWRWSGRRQHRPNSGGGGSKKKTSVGDGGDGGFTVHWCGGDGQADSMVTALRQSGRLRHRPGDGGGGQGGASVDSATSKKVWEDLAVCRRPSQNPLVWV
jgi:hypothetical protein